MLINKIEFQSITSTNTWAKLHAHELNNKALTIITAEEQTAGRGRFKREWLSPKGYNLYITYVVFVNDLKFSVGNLPQVMALTAYESLHPLCHFIRIKWPNDLVVGNKKLGGILCEVVEINSQFALILGIGININMPKIFLEKIDRPATSLMEESGHLFDRKQIAEDLHVRFASNFFHFLANGFRPFLNKFRKSLIHKKGDNIRFSNFQAIFEGVFQKINSKGELQLILPNGTKTVFSSGELI